MRSALIVVFVVALASTAVAQSRGGRPSRGDRGDRGAERAVGTTSTPTPPTSSIGLPLPQIGLPLPTLGLPLPPTGLPQPSVPTIPGTTNRNNRLSPLSAGPHRGLPQLIYAPVYGWPYLQESYPYQDPYPQAPLPPLPTPEEVNPTGGLSLELQPGVNPQIFIDGYFVAMLSDVGDQLIVDAGSHTLELREDGFESLQLDVQIPRDQVVMYRGALKALHASEPVRPPGRSAPAPAPTTIYVIPGCYVGNVIPSTAKLPAGCDARDAVVFRSR